MFWKTKPLIHRWFCYAFNLLSSSHNRKRPYNPVPLAFHVLFYCFNHHCLVVCLLFCLTTHLVYTASCANPWLLSFLVTIHLCFCIIVTVLFFTWTSVISILLLILLVCWWSKLVTNSGFICHLISSCFAFNHRPQVVDNLLSIAVDNWAPNCITWYWMLIGYRPVNRVWRCCLGTIATCLRFYSYTNIFFINSQMKYIEHKHWRS